MEMKKWLVLLFAIVANECYAYDFSSVCSTGQTLYYNITSDSTVEVTYPSNIPHGSSAITHFIFHYSYDIVDQNYCIDIGTTCGGRGVDICVYGCHG